MDDNDDPADPAHVVYREGVGTDGYVTTKVPLKQIRILGMKELEARITGPDRERYDRYSELISDGHYANGVPIVYRTPKGTLIASDLRHSDLVFHAELNVKVHPSVPRNAVHPMISVKIVEIADTADIPAQRATYLERQPKPKDMEKFNLGLEAGRSDAGAVSDKETAVRPHWRRTENPFGNDAEWEDGYHAGYAGKKPWMALAKPEPRREKTDPLSGINPEVAVLVRQFGGKTVTAREIASNLGLPPNYVAELLKKAPAGWTEQVEGSGNDATWHIRPLP